MAQKRKDSKGRILRLGETQLADGQYKGRYAFNWIDSSGKRHSVNSWRLTPNDPLPSGKRMCKPLRVLEDEIAADKHDGIDYSSKNKTLNEVFDSMMEMNTGLKLTTRNNYLNQWNCNVRDSIGKMRISDIKYSDIKKFYQSLLNDKRLNISSVSRINCRIRSTFELAVRDKIISADPSRGVFKEVSKTATRNPKQKALTKQEQDMFLNYVKDKENGVGYYLLFLVLFGTGMRISEILGLTWSDIDFTTNTISVTRNLLYRADITGKEGMHFYITSPKTEESRRTIPMLPEVRSALIRQKEIDLFLDKGFSVDGLSGFVFLNKYGRCRVPSTVNEYILRCVDRINALEEKKAASEAREPQYLRKFSAHTCRHSFATRLFECGIHAKVVQKILGHSDISITLNIYTNIDVDFQADVFESLDGVV